MSPARRRRGCGILIIDRLFQEHELALCKSYLVVGLRFVVIRGFKDGKVHFVLIGHGEWVDVVCITMYACGQVPV